MALNDNALITEAELEAFLQVSLETAYAELLINYASDFIQYYTNRWLKAKTYTSENYDGPGDNRLYLDNWPINSVTTLINYDSMNDTTLYTFTEKLEYLIYGDEGYIYLRGGFAKGIRIYRVTYNGGYAVVPYDLKKACSDLCSLLYYQKDKVGMKAETIGRYSYQLDKSGMAFGREGIPAEIKSILNRYRRVVL